MIIVSSTNLGRAGQRRAGQSQLLECRAGRMGQTGFHKENDRLFFKARRRRKFLTIWDAEYQDSCIFGQGMKGFRRLPSAGRAGQRRAGQGRNLKRRAGRPVCPAL